MKALGIVLLTGMFIGLSGTNLFAKQALPPKYDEAVLKENFDAFMISLDTLTINKGYPKVVQKLLSSDPEKQIQAVKTLAETDEIEAIPWLLPFLDAENKDLRIWTGSSLEKLVSSYVLKRQDKNMPEIENIKSLRSGDRSLRPLAWVVLKMFRKRDDGNTHAYAASMAGYLGLNEFERELGQCLKSRHPAVSNQARWALESLGLHKQAGQVTVPDSSKTDIIRQPVGFRTIDFSTEFWDSIETSKRMSGVVSERLAYDDINEIIIVQLNMHVPIGDYLKNFIKARIDGSKEFHVGRIKEELLEPYPYLTAVFKVSGGEYGLLTAYPKLTIIELRSREGVILEEDR